MTAGRSRSMAAPSNRMAPCEARMTPEMVRLSVDLPVPFEPSTATISPGPTVDRHRAGFPSRRSRREAR